MWKILSEPPFRFRILVSAITYIVSTPFWLSLPEYSWFWSSVSCLLFFQTHVVTRKFSHHSHVSSAKAICSLSCGRLWPFKKVFDRGLMAISYHHSDTKSMWNSIFLDFRFILHCVTEYRMYCVPWLWVSIYPLLKVRAFFVVVLSTNFLSNSTIWSLC